MDVVPSNFAQHYSLSQRVAETALSDVTTGRRRFGVQEVIGSVKWDFDRQNGGDFDTQNHQTHPLEKK